MLREGTRDSQDGFGKRASLEHVASNQSAKQDLPVRVVRVRVCVGFEEARVTMMIDVMDKRGHEPRATSSRAAEIVALSLCRVSFANNFDSSLYQPV